MNCLHICNDFMGSKVHENLYRSLENQGVSQTIFYPLRAHVASKADRTLHQFESEVISSEVLSKYHRILFKKKINFLYTDLLKKTDIHNYDLIHATTLFSDGAIALKLWKEYGVPYVAAIRGTDTNLFLKLRPDLRSLGREIITNAKCLIFISNSLKQNFFKFPLIKSIKKDEMPPYQIVFNGVDSYWLKNKRNMKLNKKPTNLLYIGKLNRNKNIIRLIEATLSLSEKYEDLKLTIVGSGGGKESRVKELALKHKNIINYLGSIYNKAKLLEIYGENDIFTMPSISETFGLVYVEALSQGLPVIYSKNQGVDGSFNEYIGESVNPYSVKEIAHGIDKTIMKYSAYEIDQVDFSKFLWDDIAKTYVDIYKTIISAK